MEILPLGPVVIIDTAGIDDVTTLGELRTEKTKQILDKTDIAVLVVDVTVGMKDNDRNLIKDFEQRKIPYLLVYNKSDIADNVSSAKNDGMLISAKTGDGINELREKIGHIINDNKAEKYIIRDRINKGDIVVLVIPIDESAPKGRVILPQQNVLREVLDANAAAVCCQPDELEQVLSKVEPKFVITDSQVFNKVKKIVPDNIILTSFSILMANYKGSLQTLLDGADKISKLKDGDKVLISEGCTHHRQCNDIGTVKFPKWIKEYSGKNIEFDFTQGGEFPSDLSKYTLIIHCGGCMLNEQEMKSRVKKAKEQNIPIVNYGMAIAYMNGILDRALEIFKN
jgi:[FeFe] hydrogenase H-cluster maturation GTPase HydF